jgi:hypothetical protein
MVEEEKDLEPKESFVDKLKKIHLANSGQAIIPPKIDADRTGDVAILKALSSNKQMQEIELRYRGFYVDSVTGKLENSGPIMNDKAVQKFIGEISAIQKKIEFGNYKEEDIGPQAAYLFAQIYPEYTIRFEEYGLEKSNFSMINIDLVTSISSSFSKATGAGHRNAVRGAFSEGMMSQIAGEGAQKKKQNMMERFFG